MTCWRRFLRGRLHAGRLPWLAFLTLRPGLAMAGSFLCEGGPESPGGAGGFHGSPHDAGERKILAARGEGEKAGGRGPRADR